MDRREYVCNQMYKQHDLLRKGSWTDADKLEYMELNIAPYSRYWRMGMKKALKHAIRLLREEAAKADRKTEPNNSKVSEIPTGSTSSKMEQVDKDINVRCKTEPQTEPQTEKVWNAGYKTGYDKGYKDAQKVKDSQDLVKDLVDDEFNPYDEECMRCKHLKLKCEFVPSYCKYELRDEPQTERSE